MLKEINFEVGRRAIDDRSKISLEGALIKEGHKEVGIVILPGMGGAWTCFVDNLALPLSDSYSLAALNFRNDGKARGRTLVNDVLQIEEELRDRLETDKIVYLGHSLGSPIAARVMEESGRSYAGFLGLVAYPSVGDVLSSNPNPDIEAPLQFIVNNTLGTSNFGIFAYPLRGANLAVPSRFIIAENDSVVRTQNEGTRERFQNYFDSLSNASSVAIPGNHIFGLGPDTSTPYLPVNKNDCPDILVGAVREFVETLE